MYARLDKPCGSFLIVLVLTLLGWIPVKQQWYNLELA